jgi:hypothetical protein
MSRRNLSLGINIQNIIKVITIFVLPHHVFIRYFIIMSLPCNLHHTTQCRFCYMFFVEHCAAHTYVFIPIVWYYVICLRWKRSMRVFFIVCLYTYCRWIPSYQEGIWDHINWLTPQPFSTGAKPGYWFPMSYVKFTHFCVTELKWEVIVHVADNSGMSYQNSLNFLFVIRHGEGGSICLSVSILTSEKTMPTFVQASDYNRVSFSVSLTI